MTPETPLERRLLAEAELQTGLAWMPPWPGDRTSTVADHVDALLARIDADDPLRSDLRLVALLHDSFKAAVEPGKPYSPANDHAVIARRFAERFLSDERLLSAIELHDEPYWAWRSESGPDIAAILAAVADIELFARFVALDGAVEGRDPRFLEWLDRHVRRERRRRGRRARRGGRRTGAVSLRLRAALRG